MIWFVSCVDVPLPLIGDNNTGKQKLYSDFFRHKAVVLKNYEIFCHVLQFTLHTTYTYLKRHTNQLLYEEIINPPQHEQVTTPNRPTTLCIRIAVIKIEEIGLKRPRNK